MSVVNRTKHTVLHEHPRWATTTWQHAKGFMFRKPGNDALIFLFMPSRRISLHMFFVFGPIDVLALDGQGKVIALKKNFRPWTLWWKNMQASAILELPSGTIEKTHTALGDMITLPKPPV